MFREAPLLLSWLSGKRPSTVRRLPSANVCRRSLSDLVPDSVENTLSRNHCSELYSQVPLLPDTEASSSDIQNLATEWGKRNHVDNSLRIQMSRSAQHASLSESNPAKTDSRACSAIVG